MLTEWILLFLLTSFNLKLKHQMQTSISRYLSLSFLFICLATFNSCDDGDETTTDPLVGKYKFVSATLAADTELDGFKTGADATAVIRNSIFTTITCTTSSNTALELRASKELYFLCIGESKEVNGGTWSHEVETELVLNVNTAIGPVSVTVKNLAVSGNTLTGKFGPLPIPKNLYTGVAADASILVQTQANLVFQKQ
jgi:hypothetical protein